MRRQDRGGRGFSVLNTATLCVAVAWRFSALRQRKVFILAAQQLCASDDAQGNTPNGIRLEVASIVGVATSSQSARQIRTDFTPLPGRATPRYHVYGQRTSRVLADPRIGLTGASGQRNQTDCLHAVLVMYSTYLLAERICYSDDHPEPSRNGNNPPSLSACCTALLRTNRSLPPAYILVILPHLGSSAPLQRL